MAGRSDNGHEVASHPAKDEHDTAEETIDIEPYLNLTLFLAMLISEASRRTGLPPSAIRYYERIRVIPRGRRSRGGYRDFDESAVARLFFVARAKEVGFSLPEIAQLLAHDVRGNSGSATRELLRRKLQHVVAQRRSMLLVEARLRDLHRRVGKPHTSASLSQALSRWPLPTEETGMSSVTAPGLSGFGPRARQVLVAAHVAATELGHHWVGAEHLLIALSGGSGGSAASLLSRNGLTPSDVRGAVAKITGRTKASTEQQTFTPRAHQLIGIARGIALRDGRPVDPEDLLLGLLSAGESIATTVVAQAGVDLAAATKELLEVDHES